MKVCLASKETNLNHLRSFEPEEQTEVMIGLKKDDTPILIGYPIYPNYIKSHKGLNGKSPAEACGIKVEGKNKWITIIQNASRNAE